jgi:hypothetical protein
MSKSKKSSLLVFGLLGAGALYALSRKKASPNPTSTEKGTDAEKEQDEKGTSENVVDTVKEIFTAPNNERMNDTSTPQYIPRGGTPPIVDVARPIQLPKGMSNEQFQTLRNKGKLLTGKEMAAVNLRAKRDLLKKKIERLKKLKPKKILKPKMKLRRPAPRPAGKAKGLLKGIRKFRPKRFGKGLSRIIKRK